MQTVVTQSVIYFQKTTGIYFSCKITKLFWSITPRLHYSITPKISNIKFGNQILLCVLGKDVLVMHGNVNRINENLIRTAQPGCPHGETLLIEHRRPGGIIH